MSRASDKYPKLVNKWLARGGGLNAEEQEVVNLIDGLQGALIMTQDRLDGVEAEKSAQFAHVPPSELEILLTASFKQIDELVEKLHERAALVEAFRIRLRSAENTLATISCEQPDFTRDNCQVALIEKMRFYADRHLATPGRIDTRVNPLPAEDLEEAKKKGFRLAWLINSERVHAESATKPVEALDVSKMSAVDVLTLVNSRAAPVVERGPLLTEAERAIAKKLWDPETGTGLLPPIHVLLGKGAPGLCGEIDRWGRKLDVHGVPFPGQKPVAPKVPYKETAANMASQVYDEQLQRDPNDRITALGVALQTYASEHEPNVREWYATGMRLGYIKETN